MKTEITKESLEKFGMVIDPDSPISPAKKVFVENDGDAKLTLAVTRYRNCDEFAIVIDGVGQIYLNINSIEDLEAVEKLISTFDSFC